VRTALPPLPHGEWIATRAEGEFALMRQLLEVGLGMPDTHAYITPCGDHDCYVTLADAAAQQRDLAALRQFAPRAEALALEFEHTLYLAMAHRLASEWAAAQARLEQALALFEALGARWQAGRTVFELGALAQDQERPAHARDHYTAALRAFEAMRAVPDAAQARDALEAVPAR
jgi:hypothetical protein